MGCICKNKLISLSLLIILERVWSDASSRRRELTRKPSVVGGFETQSFSLFSKLSDNRPQEKFCLYQAGTHRSTRNQNAIRQLLSMADGEWKGVRVGTKSKVRVRKRNRI